MSVRLSSLVDLVRGLGVSCAAEPGSEPQIRDPQITDIVSDSRMVRPGSLFCCIRGEKNDGHDYVPMALERGAAALLCERPVASGLPAVVVPSVRQVMGEVSAAVYGNPSDKLLMVGVTGTNGKSTTTYILRSILSAAGIRSGLLGTIVESDGVRERDADRTTPESCVIQRRLAEMVGNGCGACVMETSSHGLFLGRLKGCRFDIPLFTNLNPEHLDFHQDMERYFQAKCLLFSRYWRPGLEGAVNAEDPYGRRLLADFPGRLRGFSLSSDTSARVAAFRTDLTGTSMTVSMRAFPDLDLQTPLVGNFNVWNVLAAVTALRGRVEDEAIVRGVASIPQVPGRLERYALPNGACCFIDFAHTPEALRNVLSAARELCSGRLISVFGHGGGRYPLNRPALGRVAAEGADLVIVTMDNPRDEDPADIAAGIVQGIEASGRARHQVVLDRQEAVRTALSVAAPGDVVVISGKGPERYLQIGAEKIPYSDAETVNAWIRSSGGFD